MAKCTSCGKRGIFLKVDQIGLCAKCAREKYYTLEREKDDMGKSLSDVKLKCSNMEMKYLELERANSELERQRSDFEQRYLALDASITPEMRDALTLRVLAENTKASLDGIRQEIQSAEQHMQQKRVELDQLMRQKQNELDQLQRQITVAEDAVELETFSLYIPKYPLMNVAELKEKLQQIRELQKSLLKNKEAAISSTNWTVNGSAAEGKKMTTDMAKLCLRSFNNECDMAIAQVKYNTFDRCKERMEKAFESINKLGRVTNVTIAHRYLYLKIDELRIVLEYEMGKHREKEELKALRQEERERAKLEKELEEARRAAEKERRHYEQALQAIEVRLAAAQSEADRVDLEKKKEELSSGMQAVDTKLADIDYRQSNQKAGYVYIISNIGSFGEGIYKIGMTRRLDPTERVDELGGAAVPFYFDIHAMIFSDDAPKLEAALHRAFEHRRLNKINSRREYFRVTLDEIKEVVRANYDKTVEFIDTPNAEQYRESLRVTGSLPGQ